jgi:signal transduction histidine kinase
VIVLLAMVQVLLALGVWWVRGGEVSAAMPAAPAAGFDRLAELYAKAAFRALTTADYAVLDELVKRSSTWPDVAYVSIEDAQGRILAHADPDKIGRRWSEIATGPAATTSAAAPREIVAPIAAGTDTAPGSSIGRVRLAYTTAGVSTPPLPPTSNHLSIMAILAFAALTAVPVGLGAVMLIARGSAPGEPPVRELKQVRSLGQAKLMISHAMREIGSLRSTLAEREREVERLRTELALAARQADSARVELRDRLGDVDRLTAERERWTADVARLTAEAAAHAGERDRLAGELATLRTEVENASAVPPPLPRALIDAEVGRLYSRAVTQISCAVRDSLTRILGYSRLLLRETEGPLTETQQADVRTINAAGTGLLILVNDLVDLSRAQTGTLELHEEVIEVARVLREAAAELDGKAEVTLECPDDLPAVTGDRSRLTRIVLTLLRPLWGRAHPGLHVRADARADSVSVTVAHPGVDVPDGALAGLFDPFASIDSLAPLREDADRVRLALARSVMRRSGGDLTVERGSETGAVFTLTLPTVREPV